MVALAVLQLVVIALLAVLVVGLLRSHAEVLRRLHELGAGVYDAEADGTAASGVTTAVELGASPVVRTRDGVPEPRDTETGAHDLAGLLPDGSATAVGVTGTDHTTLLAFLSSGCGTCSDFWRAFASRDEAGLPGEDTRLVIVTKGPDNESPSAVQSLSPPGVTTIMSTEAYADYRVPVSPYFILVDGPSSRIIGEGAAASWSQVSNLLRQALADAGHATTGRPFSVSPAGLNGPARERRADDELAAAGIGPGHPSLYPQALADDDRSMITDEPNGARR